MQKSLYEFLMEFLNYADGFTKVIVEDIIVDMFNEFDQGELSELLQSLPLFILEYQKFATNL